MKSSRMFGMLVLCLLFLAEASAGQAITARIVGSVQLEDGSFLPGVTVEAFSPSLVGRSVTVTDAAGAFRLAGLAPGIYRVTFSLAGFRTAARENIPLQAEGTATLRITLQAGPITEILTVYGEIPLIDVKSAAQGTTLTRQAFQALPRGRNFDGLVTAVPGVVSENFLCGLSVDGSTGGENMAYVDGQNVNSLFGGQVAQGVVFEFIDEVQVKTAGYEAEFGGSLGGVISVVTRSGGNKFHGDVFAHYSGSALRGRENDATFLDPQLSRPTLCTRNYDRDYGLPLQDALLDGGFDFGGYLIRDRVWFHVGAAPALRRTRVPTIYLAPSDPGHLASDPAAGIIHAYPHTATSAGLNFHAKVTVQPFRNLRLAASFVNNGNVQKGSLLPFASSYFRVWENDLPSRAGFSPDSFDWSWLGYSFPNYSAGGSFDWTIGRHLMLDGRLGYFFRGRRNQLDPGAANSDLAPLYQYAAGNSDIAAVPAALRHPGGWQSLPEQAMFYPHEVDRESNLSAGLGCAWFLTLAGEHAWKAGLQVVRARAEKNVLYNAPWIMFTAWRDADDGEGFMAEGMIGGGPSARLSPSFPGTGQLGDFGTITADRLALFLQDSWTVANRFTLNAGLRLEAENVPSFNDDPAYGDFIGRDIVRFGLLDKAAPRLGFVWDARGDSSLKVSASYGLYFDAMEADLALLSFGGRRYSLDFFILRDPARILDVGRLLPGGGRDYSMIELIGSWASGQSWGLVDPDLKPMAQSEISFAIEKKLRDDLSVSVRGVWRRLLRAIDDIGVWSAEPGGGFSEVFYIGNPGYGYSRPVSQGGKFSDDFWPTPKARRDYQGLSLSLQKRMGRRWMGGIHLTLSRLWGNYSGIVSSDEVNVVGSGYGRPDGNVSRYFDVWWLGYDASGEKRASNGRLPTDRPLVLKAYGAYAFPFGLNVGLVGNWMSGTPKSTEFVVDRMSGYYPEGRGDLGRTPSLWFLNLYAEYDFKLGRNTLQLSVNVDNLTDHRAATWFWTQVNYGGVFWNLPGMSAIDPAFPAPIFDGYDYRDYEAEWPGDGSHWTRDPRFNQPLQFQPPIAVRLGARFSF